MRYGIPEEVISDGGPEFDNHMIKQLAIKYGFEWNPSSPNLPNSNGMAESAMKQVKGVMKKCSDENSDPFIAILEYINTPSQAMGISPAERFFGRQLRSILPIMKTKVTPKNAEDVKIKMKQAKTKQKESYDKSAHDLPEFEIDDEVIVHPYGQNKHWKKAKIIHKLPFRRYLVELENGRQLHRNRRHLKLRFRNRYMSDLDDDDMEIDTTLRVQTDQLPRLPSRNIETYRGERPQRQRRSPDRLGDWTT